MRLRLLKLLFLLDSDWQTSRWWQRGVEERHVTRFQLRSMTDVVFARFGVVLGVSARWMMVGELHPTATRAAEDVAAAKSQKM